MKIARIEVSRHRIPLDPPFRPSWDTRARGRFEAVIVRVESDEGHVGYGSGDDMLGLEQHLDLFLGTDPLALEQHYRYLANLQFHYGRCWPLDIALWDLAGQITGQPVWRMLGGLSNRVRAYASSGTLRDPAAMADIAQRFKNEGFPAMKIRFHRADWRDDVRAVAAVRRAVGDEFVLMVDCNQGWRMAWDVATPWSMKDALQVARALEDHGVYWMEEPLYRGDYEGMAQLRAATDLRIAGAEMTRELHELKTLIDRGCLDVLQPDAVLVGGITGLRRIAIMAQEAGLVFTPHTWGNGIGLMANIHLAAGIAGSPCLEFPYDPPEWTPERRDFMFSDPITVDSEGWITLSDRPGLGLTLDDDVLKRTRV